jgi:hypothetical protein
MKKQTLEYLACVLVMLLSSCAKPLISNLEKGTYKYDTTAPEHILDVSVSIMPVPKKATEPEKPKTFFDLRDSLPHIFLKVMATKTNDPDKLIALLYKPLSVVEKKPTEQKPLDYTQYSVRFSFSNLKQYYNDGRFMHPNTRLEFLTTSLSIPDRSPITFYNIDRLENEFEDIDLGTLSRDQTVSLNAKLSADGALGTSYLNNHTGTSNNSASQQNGKTKSVYDDKGNVIGTLNKAGTFTSGNESTSGNSASADAKVSASAEADYLNSESIKEAVAVKLKRLRTGFNFSNKKLTIAQRGRPLGDISDNIYVTAILKIADPTDILEINVYSIDNLYNENNQPIAANQLKFTKRKVKFAPCDNVNDIDLTTNYEGAIRAVRNENGDDGTNALEYDDKVTYYKIPSRTGKPLRIDKNEYCKNAFKYTAKDDHAGNYVLKIAAPTEDEMDVFSDDSPELLQQWLWDNVPNPISAKLTNKRFRLYFENITTHEKIFVVKDRFTAAEIIKLKTLNNIKAEKRMP